jgi:prefoldin subunit 5
LDDEIEWLREYAEMLKEELEAVQRRINELAAEAES